MNDPIARAYLEDSYRAFRGYRRLAEGALEQISDEELFRQIDPEANSIAVLMQHIAGNIRSRWTDFLTSDGEKPDRHRDQEFEMASSISRSELLRVWEDGWATVFAALAPLSDADLPTKVFIRGEPHSVMQAINRQVAHYAHHVGQIVF